MAPGCATNLTNYKLTSQSNLAKSPDPVWGAFGALLVELLLFSSPLPSNMNLFALMILLKSVRVHFAYGSDGRSFFV